MDGAKGVALFVALDASRQAGQDSRGLKEDGNELDGTAADSNKGSSCHLLFSLSYCLLNL